MLYAFWMGGFCHARKSVENDTNAVSLPHLYINIFEEKEEENANL